MAALTDASVKPRTLCPHTPPCPTAEAPDRVAAHVIADGGVQGWSLLGNKVLLFEDTGELLPNGQIIAPHRPAGATGARR